MESQKSITSPLAEAIRAVEERYHIRGAIDALISEEPEKIGSLHRRLAKAAAAAGVRAFAQDADAATVEAAALADERVREVLGDKTIRKVIVVPNKLVNIAAG